ncbi:hypothetical protein LSM04_003698 [Trypanosoma melophagium]|uniref:uncharacterized protein n=1 Tax=Trypanosoma melophagium TaxID=715481 RepID=UPI00351A40FC|nr:hypothetical protein LSM04_003698 [Trypanosoma melophagium]
MFLRRQAFIFAPRRVKSGNGIKNAHTRVIDFSQHRQQEKQEIKECNRVSVAVSSSSHYSNSDNIEQYFLRRLSHIRPEFSNQMNTSFSLNLSPDGVTDISCSTSNIHNNNSNNSNHAILSVREDVRLHRRLSNRFTTVCDQEKLYGTAEIPFSTIHNDVYLRFKWAREALQILHKSIQQEEGQQQSLNGNKLTIPRRLVVLVLYSHTQHGVAVGGHMKRIREIVKAMLEERYNEVLGLLTVAIGVKSRSLATNRTTITISAVSRELGTAIDSNDPFIQDDVLWYPNAGLYTFNAALQCICTAAVRKGNSEGNLAVPALHTKVLIVSEGWFHPRTAAELHQPHVSHYKEEKGEKERSEEEERTGRVEVEPLPFILGSAHSEEEVYQFARYTACRALT